MQAAIFGLLAETSIHPGAGRDAGFVDLPVAREAATDYPVIVGSSFKGALLQSARNNWDDDKKRDDVFGKQEHGGSLVVSDIRLLLLPVRSLTSGYKWVTCPHLIERYRRDCRRVNGNTSQSPITVTQGKFRGDGTPENPLFLEERQFRCEGPIPPDILDGFKQLISHTDTTARLNEQVVILNDTDFTWFARFGLAINARNVLHNEKKTSENLWYEESLPPDSLFYSLLCDRNGDSALTAVRDLIAGNRNYLQVGGNETVGQGWFHITEAKGGAQ